MFQFFIWMVVAIIALVVLCQMVSAFLAAPAWALVMFVVWFNMKDA